MHGVLHVPHTEHIFNEIIMHLFTYTTSFLINIFYTWAFTEHIKSAPAVNTFFH